MTVTTLDGRSYYLKPEHIQTIAEGKGLWDIDELEKFINITRKDIQKIWDELDG